MCRYQHGFSLIELLATLLIASIMLSFAIPGTQQLLANNQSEQVVTRLRTTINFARQTAISLNANVIMCPKADNECGPRNTWHNGAVVFADFNRDGQLSPDDYIATHMQPIEQGRVYWRAFRNRSYLQFTGRGITAWQNGNLIYCSNDGDLTKARQITLNYAGRTYASTDRNGDGIHEDGKGKPLRCP